MSIRRAPSYASYLKENFGAIATACGLTHTRDVKAFVPKVMVSNKPRKRRRLDRAQGRSCLRKGAQSMSYKTELPSSPGSSMRAGNIADEYLKRRGWKESASTRSYMSVLRASVISLYEVSNVVPDTSFLVRDLVRGSDPILATERSASRAAPFRCARFLPSSRSSDVRNRGRTYRCSNCSREGGISICRRMHVCPSRWKGLSIALKTRPSR
jgi:hypothetical protein